MYVFIQIELMPENIYMNIYASECGMIWNDKDFELILFLL